MKILYFSWIRECIGVSSENYFTDETTVIGLITELINLEPRYEKAFNNLSVIKVALDHELITDLEASIVGVHEIAFFPPMTGG
tara:strand:- start:85 stop:333 length:249 start_codon:yes stop_codon:yes gene_type:complete